MNRSRFSHFGAAGVALKQLAEEHSADVCGSEGEAEMAGIALVDGVHGEATGLIGCFGEDFGIHVEREK